MEQMELEASLRVIVDGVVVSTRCDECRLLYSERTPPEEPPCEDCWVITNPANKDALQIFSVVQNQFIMGMGGPIAINQLAAHEAMSLFKIKNRPECFKKVLQLSNWKISKMNKKDE